MTNNTEKNIMIVEDAEDIQVLLQGLFLSEGYDVECVSNGAQALETLRSGKKLPKVILLDLSMPVMDGYRFREEQEKDAALAEIPIVLMTAAGDPQSRALKIGAQASLKKPFADVDTILNTVGGFFH